jgi:hypothetical protein
LFDLENRVGLFQRLAPGGAWESVRKGWSHHGGLHDNRVDPGNWQYSVFFHHLVCGFPPNHPLQWTQVLNDITVGDIIEAVLGMRAHNGDIVHREYARHIEGSFEALQVLFAHLNQLGIWEKSRDTAHLLL